MPKNTKNSAVSGESHSSPESSTIDFGGPGRLELNSKAYGKSDAFKQQMSSLKKFVHQQKDRAKKET